MPEIDESTYLNNYVRTLYADLSPAPHDVGSYANGLEFERRARQRNLAATLAKAAAPLHSYLGDLAFNNLVHEFCNSQAFWAPVCPRLAEAFCHFVRFRYDDRPAILSLALVCGVRGGLRDGVDCLRRWRFEQLPAGCYRTRVPRRVVTKDGSICVETARSAVAEPVPLWLWAEIENDQVSTWFAASE